MNDMAKKAREAMKSKARRLASEKDQKVDSSDWSPSEPLNADVKTGMRPISRRAFKKGGKVVGTPSPVNLGRKARKAGGKVESEKAEAAQYAKAKINRNVKAANEEREGIKHVGGMKKGGRAAKAEGGRTKFGMTTPRGNEMSKPDKDDYLDPGTPEYYARQKAERAEDGKEHKNGGRTKREDGGTVDAETRRRIGAGARTPPNPVQMPKNPPMPPRRPADLDAKSTMSDEEAEAFMRNRKHGGKAKARKDGGKVATTLAGQKKIQVEQAEASETHRGKASNYKHGGRAGKMMGGVMGDPRLEIVKKNSLDFGSGAQGTPYKKGGKARPGKFYGGAMGMPQVSPQIVQAAQQALGGMGGQPQMTGAALPQPSMPMPRKSGGRAKGKTNINIIIGAGKPATPDMMQPPGGPPLPPPGVPVPLPGGPGGMPMPMGGAPGGMPMPMPPPPQMPGPPMGRKSGGRISKVAKSYKDMEAGSGGAEGRLQKTDIAKAGKGAPTYRDGGKIFRSYKDMDAGSGSGLGRIEKTSIQSGKR